VLAVRPGIKAWTVLSVDALPPPKTRVSLFSPAAAASCSGSASEPAAMIDCVAGLSSYTVSCETSLVSAPPITTRPVSEGATASP
jgi:hypothetical protein